MPLNFKVFIPDSDDGQLGNWRTFSCFRVDTITVAEFKSTLLDLCPLTYFTDQFFDSHNIMIKQHKDSAEAVTNDTALRAAIKKVLEADSDALICVSFSKKEDTSDGNVNSAHSTPPEPHRNALTAVMSGVSCHTQSLAAFEASTASPKVAGFGHIILQMKDGSAGPPYHLIERRYLIGRQSYCDIRVQAPTVSQEHAQIQVDDNDHVWLVNLSRKNPVKVNGTAQCSRLRLSSGDQFTIGERVFTYERKGVIAAEQAVSVDTSARREGIKNKKKTPLGETKQSDYKKMLDLKLCAVPAFHNLEGSEDKEVIFSSPQPSRCGAATVGDIQDLDCDAARWTLLKPSKNEDTFADALNSGSYQHMSGVVKDQNESLAKELSAAHRQVHSS
jgi:hypothetical protein